MKQGSEAERARQNGKPGRSDLSKARGLVRGLRDSTIEHLDSQAEV